MSLPTTMQALKMSGKGAVSLVPNAPVPTMPPDYILVRITHVALNPTDWKHVDFAGYPDHTIGCDAAGTVVAIGSHVTKPLALGDRVAGFFHGAKHDSPQNGAFGDYAILKADIAFRVPESWRLADAATLGVGVTTAWQALYASLGLPTPDAPSTASTPPTVLVYGGSTATGLFALQFAKLSGLRVLTTCSARNFAKVRAFGADEAWDYREEGVGGKLRAATGGKLVYVLDTISEGESPGICAEALTAERGVGRYSALLPVEDFPRDKEDVWQNVTVGYSVNGEPYDFLLAGRIEAGEEDLAFGRKVWTQTEQLAQAGKIKTFATEREGGWKGVLEGLQDLKNGKVSGEKLVYKVT